MQIGTLLKTTLAFLGRNAGYLLIGVIILLATVLKPYSNSQHIRSDGVGYHLWTHAILSGEYAFIKYRQLDEENPRLMNQYAPGVALLRFPVMMWLADPDQDLGFTEAEHRASQICAAIALLVIVVVLGILLTQLGCDRASIQLALLFCIFGTGLFHYATYDNSFTHLYTALLVAFIALALLLFLRKQLPVPGPIFMILAMLTLMTRSTNLFILAITFGGTFLLSKQKWRAFEAGCFAVLGIILAFTLQLFYNFCILEEWTLSSYREPWFWHRPMAHAVMFSYERGLFTYYPLLLLILVLGFVRPALRWPTGLLVINILLFALLYGFWHSWYLGGGFGHRGFVDLVPFFAIILAYAFSRSSRPVFLMLTAIGYACTAFTAMLMWGYWRGWLPFAHTTREVYWENVLQVAPFEWIFTIVLGLVTITLSLFHVYATPRQGVGDDSDGLLKGQPQAA